MVDRQVNMQGTANPFWFWHDRKMIHQYVVANTSASQFAKGKCIHLMAVSAPETSRIQNAIAPFTSICICSTIDTLDIVRLDLSLSMCLMSPLNFTSSRNIKKRHVVFMASCSGVHRGTGSWIFFHASLRQYVLHSLRLGVLGVTEIAPSLNIGCVDWHRWLEDIRKWFYGYQTKSHPITKNTAWDFAASPAWHHRAWTQIKLEAFLPKAIIEMVVFFDGWERISQLLLHSRCLKLS